MIRIEITKDQDGLFVADCPGIEGCHTQAKNLQSLLERLKEVFELLGITDIP